MSKSVLTVTYLTWISTEDSYEHGEVGKGMTVLDESNVGRYEGPGQLMRDLVRRFGLPEDKKAWGAFDGENGRIEVQFLVNADNHEASPREIERWKKGEERLWAAHVSIYIVESVEKTPSPAEISRTFGIQVI